MPRNLDANHAEHQTWLTAGSLPSAITGSENLVRYRIAVAAPRQWTPLTVASAIAFLIGAVTSVVGYWLNPSTPVPPDNAKS